MSSALLMQKTLPYLSVLLENNRNKKLVYSILCAPQRAYILKAILEILHNLFKSNIVLTAQQKKKLKPFNQDILQLLTRGKHSPSQRVGVLLKVRRGKQLLQTLLKTLAIPLAQQIANG